MRREVILPANPLAPSRARRALSEAIPPELDGRSGDAGLALSEVVTNAIAHGGLRAGRDIVRLVIDASDDRVRVEVEQKSATENARVVQPRSSPGGRIGGFGLGIVQATADSWGVEEGPPGRVWFEFRCAQDGGASGVLRARGGPRTLR